MKHTKYIILTAIITLLAFTAVLYSSCDKPNNSSVPVSCSTIVCNNGGTCNDDTCICPTGYTGTNCQTTYAQTVAGTYSGTYNCSTNTGLTLYNQTDSASGVYMTVSVGSEGCLKIDTLYGTTTDTTVSFPLATFKDLCGNSYTYSANGIISGTSISLTWVYTIVLSSYSTTCTYVGSKP